MNRRRTKGFTLVELALVLLIIGLLIAGTLKAQQLLVNAKVVSTIEDVQNVAAATTAFSDTYGGLPGDLPAADVRVPNCARCGTYGAAAGDGTVGFSSWAMAGSWNSQPFVAVATPPGNLMTPGIAGTSGRETVLFWVELAHAGLINGVTDDGINGAAASFGGSHPRAPIGGGFIAGPANLAAAIPGRPASAALNLNGLVLMHMTNISPIADHTLQGEQSFSPAVAAQFDRRIDDGLPATGSVQAYGFGSSCYSTLAPGTGTNPVYDEGGSSSRDCGLYFRIY